MNLGLTMLLTSLLSAAPALEAGELSVSVQDLFDVGTDRLSDRSEPVLKEVETFLAAHPEVTKLRVEVHTDSLDLGNANQELSESRARALVAALVARGIACQRLVAVGFGGTRPIASNDDAQGRAQNRRARFVRAQVKGEAANPRHPLDGGGKVVTACK